MSEYVIMPKADYVAACDAIRAKTGKTDLIKSGDMEPEILGITTGGGSSADVRYVTFMNDDGTVKLGKKAVAVGDDCADPIARGVFDTPTKESASNEFYYEFFGEWSTTPGGEADSEALKTVNEDRTVYAVFRKVALLDSGTCGTNVTWTLSDQYVLTIAGTGAMADYTSYNKTPWYAYYSKIVEVVIKDGVTHIGESCFEYCYFTKITIPNSVTSIGDDAFSNLKKLVDITIPDSVTTFGKNCFSSCKALANVKLPESDFTAGLYMLSSCEKITQIELPSALKTIPDYFLYDSYNLVNVTIPNGVEKIGTEAFYATNKFKTVTIPESVKRINKGAFGRSMASNKMTSVTIEGTSGWTIYDSTGTTVVKTLTAAELADAASVATMISITYMDNLWLRNS